MVPDRYAVPTYQRIIAAGAQNCHFTYWDRIIDTYEHFDTENGEPYEYLGHFAWIPMFNDDCRIDFDGKPVVLNGKEVTIMEWLGQQSK